MKQVSFFEYVLDEELFRRVITQDGDIELHRIKRDMPVDEVDAILARLHGYHTRGGSQLVPENYHIDRKLLSRCPNLLAVCTGGAGYDSITVADCTEAGILVANQAGLNAEAVAEHAVGMMLALSKRLAEVNTAMRHDPDLVRHDYRNNDVFGQTMGIVGLGQIGKRVAEICRLAFNMEVIAAHPRLSPEQAAERGARLVGLDELLESADFVLVACGLNDETRGMFGRDQFRRMKDSAYFITIGRGGIHDEAALAAALEAGELAGAGLDVWMQEPPPIDHPLLKFNNVFASPHIAAITRDSARKAMTGAAEQWRQILKGEYPPRIVNPEVWPLFSERFEAIMGHPVSGGPGGAG